MAFITRTVIIVIACTLLLNACHKTPPAYTPPVHSMPSVDTTRYKGIWYEIASTPLFNDKNCYCYQLSFTDYPNYTLGKITCRENSATGPIDSRTMTAYPVPGTNHSQFKIDYLWPLQFDYWIVYLDKDYQTGITGTPDHRYYWIYAREPQISHKQYKKLLKIAAENGYTQKYLHNYQQCVNGRLVFPVKN